MVIFFQVKCSSLLSQACSVSSEYDLISRATNKMLDSDITLSTNINCKGTEGKFKNDSRPIRQRDIRRQLRVGDLSHTLV